MTTLVDIATQLAEPFALDDIDFLPKGKIERDGKTLCMALPYADPRVYQDRLNSIAYGEWSTPAPVVIVAGNKLICYVTVILYGVPHTDVGEANNNEENTGTEAWAQAFKRACSQFGLGRYLYNLEKEWVPYNPQRKQIELDKAGRQAIVRKMYQKAGIAIGKPMPTITVKEEPASNGHAESDIVIDNLKARILKVQQRAVKNGIKTREAWATFRKQYAGVESDDALTVVGLAKMDGELTIREKAVKHDAT